MPTFQLYIETPNANGATVANGLAPIQHKLSVPLNGSYNAKMWAIWYGQSTANPEQVIQFRSPQMRMPYGSIAAPASLIQAPPYPIMMSTAAHQISGPTGQYEWIMEVNGYIEIDVVDLLVGFNAPPISYGSGWILTINLEERKSKL